MDSPSKTCHSLRKDDDESACYGEFDGLCVVWVWVRREREKETCRRTCVRGKGVSFYLNWGGYYFFRPWAESKRGVRNEVLRGEQKRWCDHVS